MNAFRKWRRLSGDHLFYGILAIFVISVLKEAYLLSEIQSPASETRESVDLLLSTREISSRHSRLLYQDEIKVFRAVVNRTIQPIAFARTVPHKNTKTDLHDNLTVQGSKGTGFRFVVDNKPNTFQQYHKNYQVNCSAVFAGNEAVIKSTNLMLNESRNTDGMLPVPSTEDVLQWVKNCSKFKQERQYIANPLSSEEAKYPIAYSIVVYNHTSQVERLLRAIYHPQNVYCFHVDKKSSPAFHQAINDLAECFDNVFVAPKNTNVRSGGISALRADLHCMRSLLKHPVKWKYVINLCGKDFPLKTNLEIVRQLKAYENRNCVEGYFYTKHENRTKYTRREHKLKTPPPHNITIYKGDTYMAGTRAFIYYITHNKKAKTFYFWLNDTYVPDEYFAPSLNRFPQAPGSSPNRSSMECNVRYRKWSHDRKFKERPECIGINVHELCIFGVGYLKHLYRTSELFVNKLGYDYDPVAMQCMEEELNHRTLYPAKDYKWPNFPVGNYSWQREARIQRGQRP